MSSEPKEGVVQRRSPRARYLWAWAFPVLAAAAALWLLWKNWASQGPEIVISFEQAPGMVAGRTQLLYRGFPCGEVVSVRLTEKLDRVEVRVQLKFFAAGLAREGSEFWIEQPVISLQQTAGLESLIQGNSLRARAGKGAPRRIFRGLESPPLDPIEDPALSISLQAREVNFIERGAPVYHRGVRVGAVAHKSFNAEGEVVLQVVVAEESAHLVRSNSRFWVLPTAVARLRGRSVDLRLPGLEAVVSGGVAFDEFSGQGEAAKDGDCFVLYADRNSAQAEGPPITVVMPEAAGVVAGVTPVEWLGQPAGVVEKVTLHPQRQQVELTLRLSAEATEYARDGARFILESFQVGLGGISGWETLLSGPVIRFIPGAGEPQTMFAGEKSALGEDFALAPGALPVRLSTAQGKAIRPGTPLLHRGLRAGRILNARAREDGSFEMDAEVSAEFRHLVTSTCRFWVEPALRMVLASGRLELDAQGLEALAHGAVCFDEFGGKGQILEENPAFELHENEALAAAVSPPIQIHFTNARGLLPGHTELRYLGIPVGVVSDIKLERGLATVTARFRPGFDFLRAEGSRFQLVKPRLTLEGFTGLETFLSGVYIECLPGNGPLTKNFTGAEVALPLTAARDTVRFFLDTAQTIVRPGAPVLFRETPVGNVLAKELQGEGVRLTIGIQPEHQNLIRSNSRFVDASGLQAKIGPFPVRLPGQTILDPLGRIELFNPKKPGPPAPEGSVFSLQPTR